MKARYAMPQGITNSDFNEAMQPDQIKVHYDQVKDIFDILNGKKEADILLKNLNILDVHSETVYQGSILVYNQRIVALNADEAAIKVREVFDGEGLYAIPGLIDAHIHFESQLAHPAAFAEAIVPCGTRCCRAPNERKGQRNSPARPRCAMQRAGWLAAPLLQCKL